MSLIKQHLYLQQINEQMEKPIYQQIEDVKVAAANLCVAVDKMIEELEETN